MVGRVPVLRLRVSRTVLVMVPGGRGLELAHPAPLPETFVVVDDVDVRGRYTAGVLKVVVFGHVPAHVVGGVVVAVIG